MCLNWASSSFVSSALGRSRSTRDPICPPRTVISRKGGCSDGSPRLRASLSVAAMKALILTPGASASRRTCLASRSSIEHGIVSCCDPSDVEAPPPLLRHWGARPPESLAVFAFDRVSALRDVGCDWLGHAEAWRSRWRIGVYAVVEGVRWTATLEFELDAQRT